MKNTIRVEAVPPGRNGIRPPVPVRVLKLTARRAAVAAGEMLMRRFERERVAHRIDAHDVKLDVDCLSEKVISGIIKKNFPHHGILAEESGLGGGPNGYLWIVDPLDGTVNYFHRIPYFCVSLACYYRCSDGPIDGLEALGTPLVGVIYAPATHDLYVGALGEGATLNGSPIRPGAETSLQDAVVGMSFGSGNTVMERMERLNAVLVRSVRKVRIFGSTGLDMAGVACGRTSGLVQGAVRSWDFAAARVILEQSGGLFDARVTDGNRWEIIAGAPGIYGELEAMVRRTGEQHRACP